MPALSTRARAVVVAATVATLAIVALPTLAVAQTPPPSPFQGRTLYVDPYSAAARDVAALRATDPTTAQALERISRRAQADWFGDWNHDVHADVASRVATIRRAGAYPVLVAYDIPMRDCGSYSGGGATSGAAYLSWIDALRAGIGDGPAAVILEPDALALLDCLPPAAQAARVALLRNAVKRLASGGNVAVYLDAGHAGWVPPDVMASRLSAAGVVAARGFALNVSNFGVTADEIAYGRRIAPTIGWKRFVIDTSRNGVGPTNGTEAWCNPPQRELGQAPTAATGDRIVDAFLWIKRPGESDGTCRGGPAAGEWWRQYAVDLAVPG